MIGKRLGRFITHFAKRILAGQAHQQIVFSYKPKPGAEEGIPIPLNPRLSQNAPHRVNLSSRAASEKEMEATRR